MLVSLRRLERSEAVERLERLERDSFLVSEAIGRLERPLPRLPIAYCLLPNAYFERRH